MKRRDFFRRAGAGAAAIGTLAKGRESFAFRLEYERIEYETERVERPRYGHGSGIAWCSGWDPGHGHGWSQKDINTSLTKGLYEEHGSTHDTEWIETTRQEIHRESVEGVSREQCFDRLKQKSPEGDDILRVGELYRGEEHVESVDLYLAVYGRRVL